MAIFSPGHTIVGFWPCKGKCGGLQSKWYGVQVDALWSECVKIELMYMNRVVNIQ